MTGEQDLARQALAGRAGDGLGAAEARARNRHPTARRWRTDHPRMAARLAGWSGGLARGGVGRPVDDGGEGRLGTHPPT